MSWGVVFRAIAVLCRGSDPAREQLLSDKSSASESGAAPCTLRQYCPSAQILVQGMLGLLKNMLYAWMFLGTFAGNFLGTLAGRDSLPKHWGAGAWILVSLAAAVCFFGNVPYNMTPILDFGRKFTKKPDGNSEGGRYWLVLKGLATLAAFFVNLVAQAWAIQTCQIAGRTLGFGAVGANIMTCLFYPVLVLLGTTFVADLLMRFFDLIGNISERMGDLYKIEVDHATFWPCGIILSGLGYCIWELAVLESKAGHDYEKRPEPEDVMSMVVSVLCRHPFAYYMNLVTNLIVYGDYTFKNVLQLHILFADLLQSRSGPKWTNMLATIILSLLSAGLMAFVGVSNDVAVLPIIIAVAVLNAAPMARAVNCVGIAARQPQGCQSALTAFKGPLTSFDTSVTPAAPSPV